MENLFMENSHYLEDTRLIEKDADYNINYGDGYKIQPGEFCYLLLKNEQEFLGEVLDIDYTDENQIIIFLLGINGKEYGLLLNEIEKHLTIEEESTQLINVVHDHGCNCGCCDNDEHFDVINGDIEEDYDSIPIEEFEKISQLTGMLSEMTQEEAAVEMNILKKSVF